MSDGEDRLVLDDGNVEEPLSVECRCAECAGIHSEFIGRFGKWPSMSHAEGQELAERRRSNERSWDRATRGDKR